MLSRHLYSSGGFLSYFTPGLISSFSSVPGLKVIPTLTDDLFHTLFALQIPDSTEVVSNPLDLVHEETEAVSERIRLSVVTEVPALSHAADYLLKIGAEGKRVRPGLILLLATSLSPSPPPADRTIVDQRGSAIYIPEIRRRQQRLAEIAELIHVTSLLHDDVIDESDTRRGRPSLNAQFGNKIAVLAGDFLLARTSVTLAALRTPEVIMLMAQVLENLVSGEIMQLTGTDEDLVNMEYYAAKTFNKTASLMANSAKSVCILGEHSAEICELGFQFGKHLGMAFQIVDDIMDFTSTSGEMGKPGLNDLKSGISTAPVLFALEKYPELKPMILRQFKQDGDVEKAVQLVEKGNGIEKARTLAMDHIKNAREIVRN
eukprot:g1659.t1